ncbi:MAG: nucleoside hydrolase [Victivallales bacterium]|jgi:inosine-uridine nucleoside N-ribohydrolase|nr:nucleoside hydrolase [Victivallales bacterium]
MNFDDKSYMIPESAFPVPMILDTDTYNEIDDQFALIYALLTPERVNLRGVTAAPFLNSRSTSPGDGMEKSYCEIVRIIELMGFAGRVPAYRGATSFLADCKTPIHSEAVDFIIAEAKQARVRGEKLFVVAIGAITNVASALLTAPEIASDLVVVWLGGHDYNQADNREFNLYEDVSSAQIVIDSEVAFVRIPCNHVASALTNSGEELGRELSDCGEPGKYLYTIFKEYVEEHKCVDKVIWDISAVSYLTSPQATEWEIVPREKLQSDSSWDAPDTARKMLIARKINRETLFCDIYSRLRSHVKGYPTDRL